MVELLRSRGTPIAVSCLLHLGLATGLVVGQHWVSAAIRPPVLPVQLVTLETREEPPREAPPAPRAPIRPPRLLEPPRPQAAAPVPRAEIPATAIRARGPGHPASRLRAGQQRHPGRPGRGVRRPRGPRHDHRVLPVGRAGARRRGRGNRPLGGRDPRDRDAAGAPAGRLPGAAQLSGDPAPARHPGDGPPACARAGRRADRRRARREVRRASRAGRRGDRRGEALALRPRAPGIRRGRDVGAPAGGVFKLPPGA